MKKAFIGLLGLATVVALTGCTLFYPNSGGPEDLISETPIASEAPADSSSPEDSPSASPSPSPSASQGPALFQILYSDASGGSINVVAEISNFSEDGGSCTLSYYQGSTATVVETVKAERNVTTTQCFPFNAALTGVPKGPVQFTVSYESTNHIGESAKFEVNIP